MVRLDRYGNPIGREIQKPNFTAITGNSYSDPKWTVQGITREYNSSWANRIKNQGRYPNPDELPRIIQQMKDTRQLITDFYNEKINFTPQFLDKVSYTYKNNFRPFGRLFPSGIATMLGTSKGITYADFLNQYERNLSPVRVEDIQQIGIDIDIPKAQPVADPNIQNINLYRILFDSVKNQNYITATHLNQPFRISDIENYRNMPKQYLVTDGSKQPLTAIGAKLYFDEIEELGILDSVIGSFETKPVQIDTYTYTTSQGQNVTLEANGKTEIEVFEEFKKIEKQVDSNKILGKSFPAFTAQNKFEGVTIGSIIAGALGITFLMSTLNKRGRY